MSNYNDEILSHYGIEKEAAISLSDVENAMDDATDLNTAVKQLMRSLGRVAGNLDSGPQALEEWLDDGATMFKMLDRSILRDVKQYWSDIQVLKNDLESVLSKLSKAQDALKKVR